MLERDASGRRTAEGVSATPMTDLPRNRAKRRRHRGPSIAAILSLLIVGCGAAASTTPSFKPSGDIHMMIPVAAGGGTDLFGRIFAREYEKLNPGATIVPENVVGANEATGEEEVAQQRGNPNWLLAGDGTEYALPEVTSVPFTVSDFTPYALLNTDPEGLIVKGNSPYHNLHELLNSGPIHLGIANLSGPSNAIEGLLAKDAPAGSVSRVVFDGASPSVDAVLSGDITAVPDTLSSLSGLLKSGELRLLCVFSSKSLPSYPNVPTAQAEGYNIVFGQARMMMGPAGLTKAEIAYWVQALRQFIKTPAFSGWLKVDGATADFLTGKALQQYLSTYMNAFSTAGKSS